MSFPECGKRDDGWCELTTFMNLQASKLQEAQYEYSCSGKYPSNPYGTINNGVPLPNGASASAGSSSASSTRAAGGAVGAAAAAATSRPATTMSTRASSSSSRAAAAMTSARPAASSSRPAAASSAKPGVVTQIGQVPRLLMLS